MKASIKTEEPMLIIPLKKFEEDFKEAEVEYKKAYDKYLSLGPKDRDKEVAKNISEYNEGVRDTYEKILAQCNCGVG